MPAGEGCDARECQQSNGERRPFREIRGKGRSVAISDYLRDLIGISTKVPLAFLRFYTFSAIL